MVEEMGLEAGGGLATVRGKHHYWGTETESFTRHKKRTSSHLNLAPRRISVIRSHFVTVHVVYYGG